MMKKVFILTAFVLLSASMAMGDIAGYWNFNEGTGTTVADTSGNGKNGVLQNKGSGLPTWITGHDGTGYALMFNSAATAYSNSNQVFVSLAAGNKLTNIAPVPTQAFTIVMWVKSYGKNPSTSYRYLMYTDAYDFALGKDPNTSTQDKEDWFESMLDNSNWLGGYTFGVERDAQWKYDDPCNPPWYHLAITYDGNYLRKYINGNVHYLTYPATLRAGLPVATASTGLTIAAGTIPGYPDYDGYFKGALDDVAVYKGCYLKREEILKLIDGTATPLTVTTSPVEGLLPVKNWTMEPAGIGGTAWNAGGWRTLWCTSFAQDMSLSSSPDYRLWSASTWWVESAMLPGGRSPIWLWNKWHPEKFPTDVNDANVYIANWYADRPEGTNDEKYGIEWVDDSHSGLEPNLAVFAAYVTPGYAITENDWGIHPYDPSPDRTLNWENKPYFKTYARFTTEGAPAGARMVVKVYTYDNVSADANVGWSTYINDPTILTYFNEVSIPVLGGDYQWQVFKGTLPKPAVLGGSGAVLDFNAPPPPDTKGHLIYDGNDPNVGRTLFVISIEGGDADTRLLVDEFSPISDQFLHPGNSSTYLEGDVDKNSIIYFSDLAIQAEGWLGIVGGITEPRSGGLLTNGDFYANFSQLPPGPNDVNVVKVNPTGWAITGLSSSNNYGIRRTAKDGYVNYGYAIKAPLGGSVSVQLTDMVVDDPNGVLEQAASANAVSGQTYYAMGYVMTPGWSPTYDDWRGWKDTATMDILVDGVVKATFSRKLSRNVWRPLYGSYTALAGDNGKPIKIQFSYANTHTAEITDSGYMLVGYTYLNSTMPQEYPDARDNELANGGFEDLSNYEAIIPSVVQSLRNSDNWGGWFVDGLPAPVGWVFEVPSGFSVADEAGIWASGMYGTPVPTTGMSDVSFYASNDLILGQVIGSLTPDTTYYVDMACGINNLNYLTDTNWPSYPNIPAFHIELWRIPAGVSDGTVIHDAIAAGNPNYVLVAKEKSKATGDIGGGVWEPFHTLSSKWQIVGTQYTATSADTRIYVRVYGTGGADVNNSGTSAVKPQYAFSDVYVSTQKRLLPGGTTSFNVSGGMVGDDYSHIVASHVQKYEVLGPYDCYHAVLMGTNQGDFDGNCLINLADYAVVAEDWLKPLFNDITGDPTLP